MSLHDDIENAISELKDWMKDNPRDDPDEFINEQADSSTPVYTSDILEYALEDIHLATNEPECGPAFDGSPTPTNIIAANIYEKIRIALWKYYDDHKDDEPEEYDPELDPDGDEG